MSYETSSIEQKEVKSKLDLTNLDGINPPEILAPAGGRQQFFAALKSGADAVYLGLKAFNARSRAQNFSNEELLELLPIARKYGMKVLVTVNILIKDIELDQLLKTLSFLEEAEVDAIIVQDIGVARIVRKYFPALRLHASTQLAVHNAEGVLEAASLGFKRVVVAREITATELRLMKERVADTDVEIEAFCHGSLCYSYSGLCFFSGAEDARSGNRGECAYTCRVPYKVTSEPGHGFLFSMRDLDTSKSLDKIITAGIDTLKIEGRKKDAQYVSSVVSLYRSQLNRIFGRDTLRQEARSIAEQLKSDEEITDNLKFSFHRDTTSFFLNGRYKEDVIDLNNPTHRGMYVGEVSFAKDGKIEFETEHKLERFDGLKLELEETIFHSTPQHGSAKKNDGKGMNKKYLNETLEFSIRNMSVKGGLRTRVPKGVKVSIEVPENFPKFLKGAKVFKTRSDELKRHTEKISQVPSDERLRAWNAVETKVSICNQSDHIRIDASVLKFGTVIAEVSQKIDVFEPRKTGSLISDINDVFSAYGDAGLYSKSVDLNSNIERVEEFFIPKKFLKEVKKDLVSLCESAYDDFIDSRLEIAKKGLLLSMDRVSVDELEEVSYSIKVDRLETAEAALKISKNLNLNVKELVFEPKRAFLPNLSGDQLASALTNMSQNYGIKIRAAFPTVIRAWDEALVSRWMKSLYNAGISRFEAGNIGVFQYLKKWGLTPDSLTSDFTLYSLNREAIRSLKDKGIQRAALSIEDDYNSIFALSSVLNKEELDSLEYIVFKDTPLFIAEACSLTALHGGCPTSKVCGYRNLEIENPKGEKFIVAHESCKSIVYGDEAFSISGKIEKLKSIGIKNFKIDFLTRPYSEKQLSIVLKSIAEDKTISNTHHANFERTLL